MIFKIEMEAQATADLEGIHESIIEFSRDAADRTREMIKHGILSLANFPRRCPLAPETAKSSLELRHLIVDRYRIIYYIIGSQVRIQRIVHGARQTLNPFNFF